MRDISHELLPYWRKSRVATHQTELFWLAPLTADSKCAHAYYCMYTFTITFNQWGREADILPCMLLQSPKSPAHLPLSQGSLTNASHLYSTTRLSCAIGLATCVSRRPNIVPRLGFVLGLLGYTNIPAAYLQKFAQSNAHCTMCLQSCFAGDMACAGSVCNVRI